MIVELDIFSGRPNPKWELTPDQNEELERRVAAAKRSPARACGFDGLGYRGLIVRDLAHPEHFIKIGFGQIIQAQRTSETLYTDDMRSLEHWLIATGSGKIDDVLLKAAASNEAR